MKHKKQVIFSTKWIAYTALLTALVVVMGYVPGLPIGVGKIYWCDFAIYMAAYLLDPVAALIVGGIGTTFFDLFGINGTAYNAIPSLLIHGLQGFTASLFFVLLRRFLHADEKSKKEMVSALLASIIPALIVIFGYFLKRITWEGAAVSYAFAKMPANVLQEVVGITVAFLICFVADLKGRLKKARLLPDWEGEFLKSAKAN
jgi:uncharacterized membrane protein